MRKLVNASCVLVVITAAFHSRAQETTPANEPAVAEPPQEPPKALPQEPPTAPLFAKPPLEPEPPRFQLGPSLALGLTTPSKGGLFTSIHPLLDVRFVVAVRLFERLWIRVEPGATLSWNTTVRYVAIESDGAVGVSGVPDESYTVRVLSAGARVLPAFEVTPAVVVRAGGLLSYGSAPLPDPCGGEARGGFGLAGVAGAGFRPDNARRIELGAELGIGVYPFADRCAVDSTGHPRFAAVQENPELTFTINGAYFFSR